MIEFSRVIVRKVSQRNLLIHKVFHKSKRAWSITGVFTQMNTYSDEYSLK